MEVIKITPRGYCYGVVDAVSLARDVASDPKMPRPIYILGQIVHNRHTVEELEKLGVRTMDGSDRLQLISGIDHGTVIFTAHGVSPVVRIEAARKGLKTIDATCPDVTRTHDLIRALAAQDYFVIYVGKKGHPEPEGAVGEAPDRVQLVENQADVEALDINVPRLAVVTQTTLSQWDTQAIIESIRARYPQAEVHNEICLATQQRQEAVATQSREADVVLVVGDERSNNSNRLVQVAREIAGRPAYLVGTVQDIDPAWLKGRRKVAVTSGTSTPTHITRDVIQFLEDYQPEP